MKIPPDQWHVLTGGYALDALSGPEREAFERHLPGCASCQAEVRGLHETAARLALSAPAGGTSSPTTAPIIALPVPA